MNEEMDQMADSMLVLLYHLPEVDKLRVFLDALNSPKLGRHRKNLCRDMARAANRSDKDVFGLPDAEKARLFCRSLAKLERRSASIVIAGAIAECYVPAAQRLLAKLDVDTEKVQPLFQPVRQEVPDLTRKR